jgi:hypothetical protein
MADLSWRVVSTKSAMFWLCMVMETEAADVAVVADALVVMVGSGGMVVAVILVADVEAVTVQRSMVWIPTHAFMEEERERLAWNGGHQYVTQAHERINGHGGCIGHGGHGRGCGCSTSSKCNASSIELDWNGEQPDASTGQQQQSGNGDCSAQHGGGA